MYLGRYQLGEYIQIPVQTHSGSIEEVAPTAAPQISIYKTNDTPILNASRMAPQDRPTRTGWFTTNILLDSTYSAGRYFGTITWAYSGSNYSDQFTFEVVAGGNAYGPYENIDFYERPHADYVVGFTASGTTEFRRNPKAY